MERYKKIVATLCYVEKDERVLMLLRNKKEKDMHQGMYNGLGGKSEPGEDPYSCIKREVLEEAGIEVTPSYAANLTFKNFQKGQDWEVHLFRAFDYKGNLKDCDEGELIWVDKDKIFDLNLWPGDRIFLKHMFQDKFFFGRFEYEDGALVNHEVIKNESNNL